MTKTELIALVSEKSELTKKDADKAVTAVIEAITEALEKGDKVSFSGFGTFEVKERKERQGHNPRTGETMTIARSKAPVFKAGSALKAVVNK
ncbi:MAG: HU family DNA-binding protein [Oscillospiraceae bacterium]|nr:HU family DNA-binding protein [Oscillospiraceae bacterium]MDY4585722.1 HU family DNA-binding protein [Oscillospiraceae bacterium]